MKTLSIIALAALSVSMTSCKFISISEKGQAEAVSHVWKASESFTTKAYEVSDFNELRVSIPCKLVYVEGKPFMDINCPDNLPEILKVECSDGQLSIGLDPSVSRMKHLKDVTITVSSSKLNRLATSGAVDVETPMGMTTDEFVAEFNGAADCKMGPLKSGKVRIKANGAADLDLKGLDCESLEIKVNGAGDCEIIGTTKTANIEVNGAGDIDIRGLNYDNIDSKVNGAGKIRRK